MPLNGWPGDDGHALIWAARERRAEIEGDERRRAAYHAWLDEVEGGIEASGRGARLDDYMRWCDYDGNLPWRLGTPHLVVLLDEAIERIETLELALDERGEAGETPGVNNGEGGRHETRG